VVAESWETRFGGKGANQALCACRQGAIVSLIGCLGNDAYAQPYLDHLAAEGLNVTTVALREEAGTGTAFVFVNPGGENSIVCFAGANALLTAEDVLAQDAVLGTADIVLCQFESPLEAVTAALRRASELGKTTMLNPSPLNMEFPWGELPVDFLIVNEREAAALLGYFVESTSDAPRIRAAMAELGVSTLIITRGAQPTIAFSAHQALKVPPPEVAVVDTVGAGDAFAGAFAVHWAESRNLLQALRKANVAGALATTRAGAQEAVPTRDEVEKFGRRQAPPGAEEDALVSPEGEAVEPVEHAEADENI
jgi:ribokinase